MPAGVNRSCITRATRRVSASPGPPGCGPAGRRSSVRRAGCRAIATGPCRQNWIARRPTVAGQEIRHLVGRGVDCRSSHDGIPLVTGCHEKRRFFSRLLRRHDLASARHSSRQMKPRQDYRCPIVGISGTLAGPPQPLESFAGIGRLPASPDFYRRPWPIIAACLFANKSARFNHVPGDCQHARILARPVPVDAAPPPPRRAFGSFWRSLTRAHTNLPYRLPVGGGWPQSPPGRFGA